MSSPEPSQAIKKHKKRHRESSHKHRHSSRDISNTSHKVSEKKYRESDDKYKNKHHRHGDQASSSKEDSDAKSIKEKEKVFKHEERNGAEKRHHETDIEFKSSPSNEPKTGRIDSKNRYNREEREYDGFDSSMGASFDDVLGLLNVPKKKSKKSSKSSPASTTRDAARIDVSKILAGYYNPTNYASKESPFANNVSVRTTKTLLAPPDILETWDPTRSARTLTDAEAFNHGITSKTIRTKVYSGVRTDQIYQVSSLQDLCIQFLQKNIDAIEYTGGVPYDIMEPVLKKATPHQLFTFENYNPYLIQDTDGLWQMHVLRNYRTQKPLENETWRLMYFRCQEEEDHTLDFLADSNEQSQEIAAAPEHEMQLGFADAMVEPSLNVQRKEEQYIKTKTGIKRTARVASASAATPDAAKLRDVRLKVLAAIRDDAKIASSSRKKAPLMKKALKMVHGRFRR